MIAITKQIYPTQSSIYGRGLETALGRQKGYSTASGCTNIFQVNPGMVPDQKS